MPGLEAEVLDMATAIVRPGFDASRPINLGGADFTEHKYDWYRWLLEEAPGR